MGCPRVFFVGGASSLSFLAEGRHFCGVVRALVVVTLGLWWRAHRTPHSDSSGDRCRCHRANAAAVGVRSAKHRTVEKRAKVTAQQQPPQQIAMPSMYGNKCIQQASTSTLPVEWHPDRCRRWIFFEIKEYDPHPPRRRRREGPIDAIKGSIGLSMVHQPRLSLV